MIQFDIDPFANILSISGRRFRKASELSDRSHSDFSWWEGNQGVPFLPTGEGLTFPEILTVSNCPVLWVMIRSPGKTSWYQFLFLRCFCARNTLQPVSPRYLSKRVTNLFSVSYDQNL